MSVSRSIRKKFGKKYQIPVVYYSQLMSVAYGASAKGGAEKDNGPVDHCPAERARQGWRALGFQAQRSEA